MALELADETAAPTADARSVRIPDAPIRLAVSVVGGLVLYLAFPPTGWWWCAPIGVALLAVALFGTRPRRAAWIGYGGALAFLLPTLAWVRPIGVDAWLALAAVEGLFWAALAAAAAVVMRVRHWPLWVACLWVAQEWLRGMVPVGGFPWARLAFSQGASPFTGYAALGGAPLVGFLVALCGTLLAVPLLRVGPAIRRAARWDRVVAGALLGAAVLPVLGWAVPRPGDEGRTVRIGVIQGNVPGRGMNFLGDEPAVVLRNHADQTHKLAQAVRQGRLPRPDLVVWPENSTDIDPYISSHAYAVIDAAAKDIGVPILVGAVVRIGAEHRATRGLVWDPVTGPGAYYDKRKLVPFGEYTPLKELMLAVSSRANLVGRQSVAGDTPGALRMGPVTVGTVECYEVAFDDVVRDTVNAGGTPLVVQTNNATYALTNLPPQQLAMSQLRAVEFNRAVVTAATTGISAYVNPDGEVRWHTAELVADMNVVEVPVRTSRTVASRVGALPEWTLVLMGAEATMAAILRARRKS